MSTGVTGIYPSVYYKTKHFQRLLNFHTIEKWYRNAGSIVEKNCKNSISKQMYADVAHTVQ